MLSFISLKPNFSEDLRQGLGMAGVGGSDAHRVHQIGTAATRFQRRIASLGDLIAEIKAGRMAPVDLTTAVQPPAAVG